MAKSFSWVFKRTKIPSAGDMYGLIKFFVWCCPVPGVSIRGKTLQDYGWSAGNINTLRAEIRRQSSLTRDTFKTIQKIDDLVSKLEELGALVSYDLSCEFAICYAGGKTDTDAFFYMIRNAIAHGSFCLRNRDGEHFLVLETRRNGSLRGRAVLKMKTIRRIQHILKHSQNYLH